MKNLLLQDFCIYHSITIPPLPVVDNLVTQDLNIKFTDSYGGGEANYLNSGKFQVHKIEYEWFINSLPHIFKQNRKKCDLIVYTTGDKYFFLNELTKSINPKTKRKHARKQLKQSLNDLMSVPAIKDFIYAFNIKHCIFFNSHVPAPDPTIIATAAFNPAIFKSPSQISNPDIESFGFTLWSCPDGISYELI